MNVPPVVAWGADASDVMPRLALNFGSPASGRSGAANVLEVPATVLAGAATPECWYGPDEATFGTIVREAHHNLRQATQAAYGDMFVACAAAGTPHLLRVWNFLPHIHDFEDGAPRYHQFNAGRHAAFVAAGRAVAEAPAACALGVGGSALRIAYIAARQPGRRLENPRQISAWRYPPVHGPLPPSFARAVIAPAAFGSMLLISGTASIVDHRSLHPGDAAAQTAEMARNLRSVLQAAAASGFDADPALHLRVYVRNPVDLDAVRQRLALDFPSASGILYVRADICRPELLVETEAVCVGRKSLSEMV